MKRITKIRLNDYRAFYGMEDKFEMPKGENVLIYGENGSGKSSLYQALYDFFETSLTKTITNFKKGKLNEMLSDYIK